MATMTVYGASDDLIEVEGIEGADEFYPNREDSWQGVITAPNGDTAILYVDYRNNGCWTATLGLYEEDYKLPNWPTTLTFDHSLCRYSSVLRVELPDGSKITPLD